MTNNDANAQKTAILHICECGKKYKFRQGLYSHKQKCNVGETKNATIVSTEDDKNGNPDNNKESLILTLITQNKELMNKILEDMGFKNTMLHKVSNYIFDRKF